MTRNDYSFIFTDQAARDAFMSKVQAHEPEQCWPWTGQRRKLGYGIFRWEGGLFQAHRIALLLKNGSDLACHIVTRHTCHNPSCCNPAHLVPGTHRENMEDMAKAGRAAKWHGARRGAGNPRCKLSEQAAREIFHDTRLFRVIAKSHGVSRVTVSEIKLKRTWSHIHEKVAS